MFRLFGLFCLLASSGIVNAGTVSIRTAEHDGFTRIVLQAEAGAEIAFQAKSQQAVFSVSPGHTFGTISGFFKRIGKDRIRAASLDEAGRTLTLQMACACDIRESKGSASMFIYDVRRSGAAPKKPAESVLAAGIDAFPWPRHFSKAAPNLGFGLEKPREVASSARRENLVEPEPVMTSEVGETVPSENTGEETSASTPVQSEARSAFSAEVPNWAETRLLEEFQAETDHLAMLVSAQNAGGTAASQISFKTSTHLQSEALHAQEIAAETLSIDCEFVAALNPRSWPQTTDAMDTIRSLMPRLAKEQGGVNSDISRQISLAYMSLAMGAEAAYFGDLGGGTDEATQMLDALARFLDGDPLPADFLPEEFGACDDVLVWKALQKPPRDSAEITRTLSEFDQWPEAVKGVLGPRLADLFSRAGLNREASLVLRMTQGLPPLRSGEDELAHAQVAQAMGTKTDAQKMLKSIVSKDKEAAPEAAMQLVEMRHPNTEVDTATKESLAAYRQERSGTGMEAELVRAQLITFVAEQDFQSAFEAYGDYSGLAPRLRSELALEKIADAILAIKSDGEFLVQATSIPKAYFRKLAPRVQDRLKARVSELGFEAVAQEMGQSPEAGQVGRKLEKPVEGDRKSISLAKVTESVAATANAASRTVGAEGEIISAPQPRAPIPDMIATSGSVLAGVDRFKEQLRQSGF